MDEELNDGLYSGTYRWSETHKLKNLPEDGNKKGSGWGEYLSGLSGEYLKLAKIDGAFLDAMSFPMTILFALRVLKMEDVEDLTIVIVGASVKAEQRVYRNSNYFQVLLPKRATLYFTGLEVKAGEKGFQSSAGDFLTSRDWDKDRTLVVAYNTGFGNFIESNRYDLVWSWLPDLYKMAHLGLKTVFTCANDYADMQGEFSMHMKVLASKFLLLPMENPFGAASHLHEDGDRDTAWSRSNSFMYIVQGCHEKYQFALSQLSCLKTRQQVLSERLARTTAMHVEDVLHRHYRKGQVYSEKQALEKLMPSYTLENKSTQLKLIAHMPKDRSMKSIHLQCTTMQVQISSNGKMCLSIPLPDAIIVSTAKASFATTTRQLTIVFSKQGEPHQK